MSRPRLCIATTVPISLTGLIPGQARMLAADFDVELLTSPGELVEVARANEDTSIATFPLTRTIDPRADLSVLPSLVRYFRRTRPHILQTYTPKAGLLCTMAARAARVPLRVHGVVGMPLMEARGARRAILGVTERVTYANATHLTANSTGLQRWMSEHLTRRRVDVIGYGSINGIDLTRYDGPAHRAAHRARVRAELGFGDEHLVWLFVGRVVRDKGVVELVEAFTRLHRRRPHARLLVVGPTEPELDPIPGATEETLRTHPAIRCVGYKLDVVPYLAAADAYVLPSYREGLPNGLLEAAAFGLPAVATDINGCNEVIDRDRTGLLVPAKDARALESALEALTTSRERAEELGRAGRARVEERYDQRVYWGHLRAYYQRILAER
ncbi:MAG: glycosyltransferase family 4 protein [Alphaproteobacteria bacterium]|nr:glycosyltransferase family 4 protein [Alphaproteobacteria bacterium]MCB9697336.1 glycosyltransferase family 4 protein [Alphaproteobacteria bacterium]